MVVVLNPLFSSCCKIGKREAGKFERARGLNALASVNRVPWFGHSGPVKIMALCDASYPLASPCTKECQCQESYIGTLDVRYRIQSNCFYNELGLNC